VALESKATFLELELAIPSKGTVVNTTKYKGAGVALALVFWEWKLCEGRDDSWPTDASVIVASESKATLGWAIPNKETATHTTKQRSFLIRAPWNGYCAWAGKPLATCGSMLAQQSAVIHLTNMHSINNKISGNDISNDGHGFFLQQKIAININIIKTL